MSSAEQLHTSSFSLHFLFYQVFRQRRRIFIRNPRASKREAMSSSADPSDQDGEERRQVSGDVPKWACPTRQDVVMASNQA